ncbi:hypothetical protein [Isoalcanivorax indicus]|uniref:hypothetical protein n=1 Tax=Isoalcanivorax indicus TaxID=2202653 RepID=UPI000DB9E3B1|nr:hypothetical protein [Isoalcanivorax indicus]
MLMARFSLRVLATLLCGLSLAVPAYANAQTQAGHVLTLSPGDGALLAERDDGTRQPLLPLDAVDTGMRLILTGNARATLDLNGQRVDLSAADSPYTVASAPQGDGVVSNLVNWAITLVRRDDDLLRAVGAVSRSTADHPVPWLMPGITGEAHLGNPLFVVWRGHTMPETVRLYALAGDNTETLVAERFQLPALQQAILPVQALSPGDYRLEICFDSGCHRQVLNLSAPADHAGDAVDAVYGALEALQRGGPETWFGAVQALARHQHEVPLAAQVLANLAGR